MGTSPFLPGLILALAVWIIPFLFRILPANIFQPAAARYPWLSGSAAWAYSLGLPYLGLLMGWISSRDYGLTGQTPAEWGLGAAAAILLGLLLAWVSARCSNPRGGEDVRAEARWCLYRAAAWPWVNYLSIAIAAGLLAGLAEFGMNGNREGERLSLPGAVPFLVRAVGSGALFLLAHNFYIAMLFYLIAFFASKPDFQIWIGSARAHIASIIPNQRQK